jgi:hypothetical protein
MTGMIDPSRHLTIDDALGEFSAMLEDLIENGSPNGPENVLQNGLGGAVTAGHGTPETPEEADTRRFLLAQHLIGLACPAPAACADPRCRREAACRHLLHVRDRWSAGRSSHPRRPPGADALRHAIWLYVASRRGGA